MKVGSVIKNILFPKICLGCGKFGSYFCHSCLTTLPKLIHHDTICPVCTKLAVDGVTHPRCKTKYSPDGLTSLFHYDGMIRKAIKQIKYQRVKELVPDLSEILLNKLENATMIRIIVAKRPIVIPVPLHRSRERSRWFNQSDLFAKSIAEKLILKIKSDMLIRTKFSKPQAGLLKQDRLRNIKDSFLINSNQKIPETVILFDDVWTTGATMRECTNVLKREGVKTVWCLTVAR